MSDQIASTVQNLLAKEREQLRQEWLTELKALEKPGKAPVSIAAGSGARTRPAWEGDYERNARNWSEAERAHRTPEGDHRFAQWLKAVARGDMEEARRADPEWARALTTAAGGDGAVAPGYIAQLVTVKQRSTSRLRNYCTVVPCGETTQRIPWEKTVPVPAIFAENSDMSSGVTESDIEALTATPKKVGMVTTLTRELLDDSPMALTTIISNRVAHAIGEAEDTKIISGTPGTDFTHSLEGTATASSDTFDDDAERLDTLASKVFELPRDQIPFARWIIGTDAAKALMSTVAINATLNGDRPLFLPYNDAPSVIGDFGDGTARTFGYLAGFPCHVYTTGAGITANTAIFGNLSSCAIVDRETLHVEIDRGSGFLNDLYRLHVSRRVDFIVMQATHVRKHPAV